MAADLDRLGEVRHLTLQFLAVGRERRAVQIVWNEHAVEHRLDEGPRQHDVLDDAQDLVIGLLDRERERARARRRALAATRGAHVLRSVQPEERAALAAEAGITGRSTRFVYVQISEGWEVVQRAGSIQEALKMIRSRRPRVGPFLWPDWLDLFEASRIWSIDSVTLRGERRSVARRAFTARNYPDRLR